MRMAVAQALLLGLCVLPSMAQTGGSASAPSGPAVSPAPAASAAASAPASAPTEADLLAAQSLRHSAFSLVYAPAATPGRGGRIIALSHFADRLAPGDPQTNLLLANVYESQGKTQLAARAVGAALMAGPDDHALGLRWLSLSLSTMDKAEERLQFLLLVSQRQDVPSALKAEALTLHAQILLGQGDRGAARESFESALKLDPLHPTALNGLLALTKDPTPVDRATVMLKLLQSNPQAVRVAWDLATLLDSLGLYEQSLTYFDYSWQIWRRQNPLEQTSHQFLSEYFNAMLDAGQCAEAIKTFEPIIEKFPQSADLRSELIEAYRGAGQNARADAQIKAMEEQYKARQAGATISVSLASETAWFYLVTLPQPNLALGYARQAASIDPTNATVQRILGAAELKAGLVADGEKRLRPLLEKDLYANLFLAERYAETHDEQALRQTVTDGAKLGRSGPAFRRLAAIAKENKIEIPPAPYSAEVLKVAEAADATCRRMGLAPQEFVSVTLSPAAEAFQAGEPVELRAVLTNKSQVPVPLGEWGLFNPSMALQATAGTKDKPAVFADLPLVTWPAPRYLQPGKSVLCTVRLDVGQLALSLARRPLEEITLTVQAILDPLQRDRTFVSAVPSVPVSEARVVRSSLMGQGSAEVMHKAFTDAAIAAVQDIKQGALPRRLKAARVVGSLLAFNRQVELKEADMPKAVENAAGMKTVLPMMQAILRDPSPVVRAEMLTALQDAQLDESIVSQLGGAVEDRSSLVRFRLAELLGGSRLSGQATIIDFLSQDSDDLVRMMARVFHKPPPKR